MNKTIPQLFEEQARKTPEAAALKMGDDCWTYRQLNIRANQIAHALIEKGEQLGYRFVHIRTLSFVKRLDNLLLLRRHDIDVTDGNIGICQNAIQCLL